MEVHYDNVFHLMEHLQGMGAGNGNIQSRGFAGSDCFLSAASIYQVGAVLTFLSILISFLQAMHGNEQGTIPATFQIIYMIGWRPHPSNPAPSSRGSASRKIGDFNSL